MLSSVRLPSRQFRLSIIRSYARLETLAGSPASILARLRASPLTTSSSPDSATLLFALSQTPGCSFPGDILDLLHSSFPSSIGCLSSPSPTSPSRTTLSLAVFQNDKHRSFHPFRSSLTGRAPAAVGRWRPLGVDEGGRGEGESEASGRRMEEAFASGDWGDLWTASGGSEAERSGKDAEKMQGLENIAPQDVSSIVLLSTPTSATPTLQSLSTYPRAAVAGLIAPPTPFCTGLPFTLFLNGETIEDGAVGVAVVSPGSKASTVETAWGGLDLISERIAVITESQGNLLMSLTPLVPSTSRSSSFSSNSNPTSHLISLLPSSPSTSASSAPGSSKPTFLTSKDHEFYLGFLRESNSGEGGVRERVERVVRIISGDPNRGGMALDMGDSVQVGRQVVFLHRKLDTPPSPLSNVRGESASALVFSTAPASQVSSSKATDAADSAADVREGVFEAASTEGFVVRKSGEGKQAWVDKGVFGGSVTIEI